MQQIIQADFNGQPMQFTDDGWFNATTAAAKYSKEPNEWLRLPSTLEYLAALDEVIASNPGLSRIWIKTKRGNNGGTWLHPKLAVVFARWLDVRFAVWCDLQIDKIIRGEATKPKQPTAISASRDRAVLLHMAVDIVLFRGIGFSKAYSLLNAYVGTDHFSDMTLEQVESAAAFAGRVMVGNDTSSDWKRIAANNADISLFMAQACLPLAA